MNWPAAIKSFHAYLMLERSMSANTLEAYIRDVQRFERYLDMHELKKGPIAIRREDLEQFVHWVNELGLEASSQARMISGLRAFYKFLLVEDLIDDDPTDLLEGPRLRRKMPEVLSVGEVQSLLSAIDLSEPLGI
ncbi:MAG: site-specific integrase, partial [Saprospiraceae bacterium]